MKLDKQILEEKIRKHRETKSNTIYITPPEAEKIIRKFYGLPDPEERQEEMEMAPAAVPDIIELEDLI